MTATAKRSNAMHGCIIMASGVGKRFGGNKLLAELDGVPLIRHVLTTTNDLFACRVVVTRHNEVAKLCLEAGVRTIEHEEPRRNDTVRLGMQAMEGCDTVTFFQGDQPLVSRETIARLLHAAENEPGCIWRASFQGTPGAPVLFPTWAFPELCALPEGKGGGFVAKGHKDRVRLVEASSAWELRDVDTVEDLHELAEHIKRAGSE